MSPGVSIDRAVRSPFRELIERLRRLAPDDEWAAAPDGVASGRTKPREARVVRAPCRQPWPRSAVIALQLLAFGASLGAALYGPPYVECRRMKSTGHFFSGVTVRACFDERFAARNERVEALARTARDRLRGGVGDRSVAEGAGARA